MSGLDGGLCGLESEVSRIELGGGGGVWVNNFTAASPPLPPPPHSSQVICPLWWGEEGEGKGEEGKGEEGEGGGTKNPEQWPVFNTCLGVRAYNTQYPC